MADHPLLAVASVFLFAGLGCAGAQNLEVLNGSFEDVAEDGVPAHWGLIGSRNWEVSPEAAHNGALGLRMGPSREPQALRQTFAEVANRNFLVSGWFKARGVVMGPEATTGDHARLYVHVLYQGRPYHQGLQVWQDIPAGTWDWRQFKVRVLPAPYQEISEVYVTITNQFQEGELWVDDVAIEPAGPLAGGASVHDWANGASPIVLTDLSQCEPETALSDRRRRGKWKVLEYEIPPYSGKLLWAYYDAAAVPVSLPLGVTGWHAIYLGLLDGKLRVKLSSDPAYVVRTKSRGEIEEVFFKAADCTGQALQIAQQVKGYSAACAVAYVKLVPLTEDEVARLKADRADPSHRRLASSIDGFSYLWAKGSTTEEELLEEIEEYRDSDVGTLYVCITGADHVNFPTKLGNHCGLRNGELLETYPEPGDRYYSEALREMFRAGINPTEVHIRGAKAMGLKVHVSTRPGAWEAGPYYEDYFTSPFYQQHPEWRCVDRDGTPIARMSFAVPEVRKHLVEVLREAVQFGADGANIIYVRGVPYVLWEEPFCQLFRERYGEDARQVPEDDPRITELRVELMTAFMREVRAMLDEEQQRRGQAEKLELSASVLANEADNLKYAIDVRGWVEQGLLDEVSPYLRAAGGTATDYDLRFFAEVCNPRGVPWRPTVIGWEPPNLVDLMNLALRYYEGGASGITFWDGNSLTTRTDQWSVASRLGHIEELRERAEQGAPQTVTLSSHRLGEFIMDARYGVAWGY